MRSGGCAVQQALAGDASAVVRQAVALARRRGHAQVTPLHVASAMLSAAGGLLRAACLRSHSHPLQCKALELCFNVALNRLPTAAIVFHGGGHHAPGLSNALVAAFKRAQAHQRRGAVEGGQQPPPPAAGASKVEIEQLIVSILDDPSVSRVMREAGFSSSQVKANVEKVVVSSPEEHHLSTTTTAISPSSGRRQLKVVDDDAATMRVLDRMAGGTNRWCAVVAVGESAAAAEGVVKAVMDRVSKGELQRRHERLRSLQFVPLSAASFRRMTREEVHARAGDLRALVRQGCAAGKGVVLVLEDLAYAAEAWAAGSERRKQRERGQYCYCPVEHGVMEVSGLVSAAGRGLDRFWLLGFGDSQGYMKCRAGQPSLEAVWELHPVVVEPDGGAVALSLSCTSEVAQQASQERSRTGWPFVNGAATDGNDRITCAEAVTVRPNLPQWLRGYQDSDQNRSERCTTSLQLQELNHNCNGSAAHSASELTFSFSSLATTTSSTPPCVSDFANDYHTNIMMSCRPWQFRPTQLLPTHRYDDPIANSYDHQTLHAVNPSLESYSVSNSSESGTAVQPKFTELTAENLKILCNALENRVSYHNDMVADIASAVLKCRSGMTRRMKWHREKPNVATWLFFHGRDSDGKKTVAQELARTVFGSYTNFTSISLSNSTPLQSKSSSGVIGLKRQRSMDNVHGHVQKLYDIIHENPHRVIMIDGVDQLECESEISIKSAITNGRITSCNGDETSLEDVIVILSCEELDLRSTTSSPRLKQRVIDNEKWDEGNDNTIERGMTDPCFLIDLNACVEDRDGDECWGASDILNIVDGVFLFQLTEDL